MLLWQSYPISQHSVLLWQACPISQISVLLLWHALPISQHSVLLLWQVCPIRQLTTPNTLQPVRCNTFAISTYKSAPSQYRQLQPSNTSPPVTVWPVTIVIVNTDSWHSYSKQLKWLPVILQIALHYTRQFYPSLCTLWHECRVAWHYCCTQS
jgi:hypothetical protein